MRDEGSHGEGAAAMIDVRALLAGEDIEAVRRKVADRIVMELARVLHARDEDISRVRPLAEIGVDSLMALELNLSLKESFGIEIPAGNGSNGLTVVGLAEEVIAQVNLDASHAEEVTTQALAERHITETIELGADRSPEIRAEHGKPESKAVAVVSRKSGYLAGDERERLLSRVEALRQADKVRAAPPPGDLLPADTNATDFTTLPGYSELRIQRAVADMVGIESPFFRIHEARASNTTRIAGNTCVNFASYDYLGLNGHPEVAAASVAAVERYGLSCSASRLVAGERPVHRMLERALADHYGLDDCAVFVSGYATNVGVIGQLLGPKDLMIYDSAIHNSAMVGGILSGANRRSFAHNDLDNLEQLLGAIRHDFKRVLIVVEGLYSMDGDYPDLPRLIEIKNRYEAWLMIDEAHALGVLGARGYRTGRAFRRRPRRGRHLDGDACRRRLRPAAAILPARRR